MGNVKIKSDGTLTGTEVFVNEVRIEGVTQILWSADGDGDAYVTLRIERPKMEATGDLAHVFERPKVDSDAN